MAQAPRSLHAAHRFLDFVNTSPTPFHATRNAAHRLENYGFQKLREKDNWEIQIKPGGKYYYTRNQASLIAFILPANWKPGVGLSIVATHVDSPNLKVRPVSKKTNLGYLQVGVETYGGGIWHSWLDRDLSLAGRIVIAEQGGTFISKLVNVERPLLRIPTLAIHLDKNINENFNFNQESEFVPILGLLESQLNSSGDEDEPSAANDAASVQKNHHPQLLELLASNLSIAPETIHDFELSLYDTQPAVLGGVNNEFIFSSRMDNLVSSFCAIEAITDFGSTERYSGLEGNVNCIALFNHEEIGSVSTSGAGSDLIHSLLSRLSPTPSSAGQSISRSFLISADMGHAIHPNYSEKHEKNHRPFLNGGVVIKTNAKQRYATDAITSFVVKQLIRRKGGKVQEFEVRNDMSCGSTVGPMLSKLGIRTVDVGNPMLSMHSIRETAGSHDVQNAIDLFTALFEDFATIDQGLNVD